MRLFVAIDFPDEVKAELWYLAQYLKHQAQHARIVPLENYHLTLLFIGETQNITEAREVFYAAQIPAKLIDLIFDGIGSFRQQRDYTWWVGVKATDELRGLAHELAAVYRAAGFSIEARLFKPHITLARKVDTKRPVELTAPSRVLRAKRLSLMRSTNEDNRTVYTEIESRELQAL